MSDYRFMLLGTENSGKSEILSSFYQRMKKSKVFQIFSKHAVRYEKGNQFSKNMLVEDIFQINYGNKPFININIMDYPGKIISSYDSGLISELTAKIYCADVLCVLVDGILFMEKEKEERRNRINMRCVRYVNPIIMEYYQRNQNPCVIFAVTKRRKALKYCRKSEILEILRQSFSYLFDYQNTGKKEPYAVFTDINKPDTVINLFLLGIYVHMYQYGEQMREKINAENEKLEKRKTYLKNWLREYNRGLVTFLINRKQIGSYEKELKDVNHKIEENKRNLITAAVFLEMKVVRQNLEKGLGRYYRYLITDFRKGTVPLYIENQSYGRKFLNAVLVLFKWLVLIAIVSASAFYIYNIFLR